MRNLVLAMSLMTLSHVAFADIAVIVNPSNNNNLDTETISRIFLGKVKSFPDGSQAIPITVEESLELSAEFNNKVLNKSNSQLKAYWSKLLFTGKGEPPKALEDEGKVLELIANNPNLIGYVDAAKVTDKVKVIAKF